MRDDLIRRGDALEAIRERDGMDENNYFRAGLHSAMSAVEDVPAAGNKLAQSYQEKWYEAVNTSVELKARLKSAEDLIQTLTEMFDGSSNYGEIEKVLHEWHRTQEEG